MPEDLRVLVVCRHNSGRSQMAQAYLRKFAGDRIHVESAGLEPAKAIHPLVVSVMREDGLDLSHKIPQSVFELFKRGILFDHVISVCSETEGQCPTYPGITRRWHMPFPDPAAASGTREEQLAQIRSIRDMIKDRLLAPRDGDFNFTSLLAGSTDAV
jgi:arsenate reductase